MNDTPTIDFTKGGYRGDPVEEAFKPFTAKHLPFWWHFREVLRASDRASGHWKASDGSALSDAEQRELVAVSLLNYAVYTALAEAISFVQEMEDELGLPPPVEPTSGSGFFRVDGTLSTGTSSTYQQGLPVEGAEPPGRQLFEVRKAWRAAYSSLYTSFNALCNIICVVVGDKPVLKSEQPVWNYTPKNAINLVSGRGLPSLLDPLKQCRNRMEIRDHLDHYWVIWGTIVGGKLLFDKDFSKGRVPIHPRTEVSADIDAVQRAFDDIEDTAQDFNLVYRQLAVRDGFLDQHLRSKGWQIDYSNYGPPHGGQRPLP